MNAFSAAPNAAKVPTVPELPFVPDPRAAAARLRALAWRQPAEKLGYAAELIRTAWELEIAAEEREQRERLLAADGGAQ